LHTAYIECTEKITKYVEESNKDYLESLLSDTSDEDKEVVEN
jgi:hypothetical protein